MANLTYAQLEGLWINAGGPKAAAPLMAAIAEAESGGDPNRTNPTDSNGQGGTQTSWGLWQISNGTHTAPSPNWNNPAVNAQLAVAKYNTQGLGAWGTYTSGAYKAFLNSSTTPDTSALPASDTSAAAGSQAAMAAQAEANCAWRINFNIPVIGGDVCILSWSQIRAMASIGFLAAGGLLGVFGVASLMATTGAPDAVKKAAGTAAEAGGAVASVAGAPEVGAPVAAAGAAAKSSGRRGQERRQNRRQQEAQVRAERGARSTAAAHERSRRAAAGRPEPASA